MMKFVPHYKTFVPVTKTNFQSGKSCKVENMLLLMVPETCA